MHKFSTRDLTLAALIAAVYAVLTVALPIPAYSGIQVRLSEALTVLPFFFPAATPGLFVGCIIANLFSPYSLDVVCGSLATLLACLVTQRMPSKWLAPLPPVLCNGLLVGWYHARFNSLSAGGMRLWNRLFTRKQCERNGKRLYELYHAEAGRIARLVEEANEKTHACPRPGKAQ